ncbi:hypothetical protein scyTo_0019552 [Scyliorhinus torazame]|uniref:UBP-type domain-containing protein n=1 Tax=Scyliorhinus torazame TaxID=75743 RepID=A0A401Q234_SCYTO|nr:hypothetical protein [Scyliorhinus torazame]
MNDGVEVCRSNKSPWVCLMCSSVHCGRYVNGHAKKHYEDAQINSNNIKKSEKHEKEKLQHAVCMDCSSYSTYWYVKVKHQVLMQGCNKFFALLLMYTLVCRTGSILIFNAEYD